MRDVAGNGTGRVYFRFFRISLYSHITALFKYRRFVRRWPLHWNTVALLKISLYSNIATFFKCRRFLRVLFFRVPFFRTSPLYSKTVALFEYRRFLRLSVCSNIAAFFEYRFIPIIAALFEIIAVFEYCLPPAIRPNTIPKSAQWGPKMTPRHLKTN